MCPINSDMYMVPLYHMTKITIEFNCYHLILLLSVFLSYFALFYSCVIYIVLILQHFISTNLNYLQNFIEIGFNLR